MRGLAREFGVDQNTGSLMRRRRFHARGDARVARLGASLVTLILAIFISLQGCSGYGAKGPERGNATYHRVQKGETLSGIGRRYGVSPDTIALLNGINDPRSIEAGHLLLIRFDGGRSPQSMGEVQRASYVPSPSVGKLFWPVAGGDIVSGFGPRSGSFHDGLDIAAPTGTPVYAAHDAIVAYSSNELGGYGNLIILQSRSSLITVYGHNSKLLVRPGQKVRQGDLIAKVGATGRAEGPHLHFEVRMKDKNSRYVAVDPLPLLNSASRSRPRYRVNESLTPLLARLVNW